MFYNQNEKISGFKKLLYVKKILIQNIADRNTIMCFYCAKKRLYKPHVVTKNFSYSFNLSIAILKYGTFFRALAEKIMTFINIS